MPTLHPYLTFNGNCREAMNFYKEVLGGKLSFMPVGETPVADQMPASLKDAILHSALTHDEFQIMATDMTPETLRDGNGAHMCLAFANEEETRRVFEKLSAGGKVLQPLHKMFFGWIGAFTDKFGKSWIVECDK